MQGVMTVLVIFGFIIYFLWKGAVYLYNFMLSLSITAYNYILNQDPPIILFVFLGFFIVSRIYEFVTKKYFDFLFQLIVLALLVLSKDIGNFAWAILASFIVDVVCLFVNKHKEKVKTKKRLIEERDRQVKLAEEERDRQVKLAEEQRLASFNSELDKLKSNKFISQDFYRNLLYLNKALPEDKQMDINVYIKANNCIILDKHTANIIVNDQQQTTDDKNVASKFLEIVELEKSLLNMCDYKSIEKNKLEKVNKTIHSIAIKNIESKISRYNEKISTQKDKISNKVKQISQKNNEISDLKDKIRDKLNKYRYREGSGNYGANISNEEDKIKDKELEIEEIKIDIRDYENEINSIENDMKNDIKVEEEKVAKDYQEEINSYESEISKLSIKFNNLEAERSNLEKNKLWL